MVVDHNVALQVVVEDSNASAVGESLVCSEAYYAYLSFLDSSLAVGRMATAIGEPVARLDHIFASWQTSRDNFSFLCPQISMRHKGQLEVDFCCQKCNQINEMHLLNF